MMSSTLGAPLGGTTLGGHHGLDCLASRLISPPNGGGGFGRYLPSMVVVAPGLPGVPGPPGAPCEPDASFGLGVCANAPESARLAVSRAVTARCLVAFMVESIGYWYFACAVGARHCE